MNWLIDFGNTNVKWSYVIKGEYSDGGRIEYAACSPNELLETIYASTPTPAAPNTVLIASVGKSSFVIPFCDELRSRYGSDIHIVESTRLLLNVINSYTNPSQLGIDRLLAMGAAYQISNSACIVVDIGTAITLDCVDQSGQHLGGLIVPGVELMLRSLSNESDKLDVREPFNQMMPKYPLLANNTSDAMLSGIHYLIVSFVQEHVKVICKKFLNEQVPTLFLTGGGSEAFKDMLGIDWIHNPSLVLKGLDFLLRAENNQ